MPGIKRGSCFLNKHVKAADIGAISQRSLPEKPAEKDIKLMDIHNSHLAGGEESFQCQRGPFSLKVHTDAQWETDSESMERSYKVGANRERKE